MKFSSGQISLLGQYVNIMPTSYFVGLTKYHLKNQKKDPNSISKLYLMGWVTASDYMKRFEEVYDVKGFVERYRLGMDVVSMAGFGDYKTIEWKDGSLSYVYTINNPLPKFFYPSKEPVDHILRGVTAGGGYIVHHNLVQCVEETCAAVTGLDKCVLINATEKEFGNLNKEDLLASQVDLDFIVPRQKEVLRGLKKKKEGFDIWEILLD
ncbi:MAG: hypothetical protein J7K00_00775 [Candidatus Diapherotrites archaeon]|nr:hypothetical protein [Candidatus Diapherotrites archaeon]